MWFGTENGLYRWDGYEYKAFHYDANDSTSISGNLISRILMEDDEGNIWIGTQASGMNIYNPNTETFTCFYKELEYHLGFDFNRVIVALTDKDGDIWLAAGSSGGINHFDKTTGTITPYWVNTEDSTSWMNRTSLIHEDRSGNLWVGTYKGLYLFDKETKTYLNPGSIIDVPEELNSSIINSFFEDQDGTLWIGAYPGLYKLNTKQNQVEHFTHDENDPHSLASNSINELFDNPNDKGKSLLIVTRIGINKLDKYTGRVTRFNNDPDDSKYRAFNAMFDWLPDDNGILWAGSGFGAVRCNLNTNAFSEFQIRPFDQDTYVYEAMAFLEDKLGNLWIGTPYSGLFKYDKNMNLIRRYNYDPNDQNGISYSMIFSLFEDSDSILWIGTAFTLDVFDQKNDRFVHCILPADMKYSYIRSNDFHEDKFGMLWIVAAPGLYYQQKQELLDTSFQRHPEFDGLLVDLRSVAEDSYGNIWFGSSGFGLYLLTPENRDSLTLINIKHKPNDITSISNDVIWSLYVDKNDVLWVGTANGLNRYDPVSEQFCHFNNKNGLEAKFIYCIEGDDRNNLWLSTEKGILRFSLLSDTTGQSKILETADGIPFEENYHFKIFKSKAGKLYVGGRWGSGNGYYSFHPDSLKDNKHVPPLVLTEFLIHNKTFKPDSNITVLKHLKLKHNQNFFSIKFAALDFINPSKNEYAYMLEGFDEDWIYCNNRRLANYTNVPPGEYLFKAKGSNNDGLWNKEGVSLIIMISPPPWKTWWAYSLYLLFLFSILYIVIRFYIKRQRLIHKLELEEVQTEKLEELDRMKSRFFANISHEFRTPLTLILGPIEKLKSYIKDKEPEEDLNIMQRNAQRLQNLINQLLSLSKLESGKMKLLAHKVNIVSLVNEYVQSFESLAKQKNIEYKFKSSEEKILLFVDREKIEKILYNLLSNAFKFTGEGGKIEVAVSSEQSAVNSQQSSVHSPQSSVDGEVSADCQLTTADFEGPFVSLSISDTGPGIPPNKLTHIFDRFYQADDNYTKDQEGSGIGLALTKELVELHHGKIIVKSLLDMGTTFTVFLPLGKDHLNSDEMPGSYSPNGYRDREVKTADTENFRDDSEIEQILESNDQEVLIDDDTEKEDSKPLLLIVEDNDDLRSYIRSYLTDDYRIIEAIDGEMGLEKSIEKIPDLVISDVMMPKMDGMEFCNKLKTDERTSHIPIILLTAKAAMEDKLEGLETGADDFLTKPFDPKELQVRIRNLIVQRSKLKEQFIRELDITGQMTSKDILSMDRQFLQKAKNIVEENMSDFDFNIENFAEKMCLSRVQLHRKLKALINRPAGEFLRIIRLNHAAGLIRSKSGNITQITFEVGFNNLSYFSKCFKEQFGMLPSEYANQNS